MHTSAQPYSICGKFSDKTMQKNSFTSGFTFEHMYSTHTNYKYNKGQHDSTTLKKYPVYSSKSKHTFDKCLVLLS